MIVTLAGRKNSWKGQLLLIKAVELIPREVRKNIVFFLVGDSPPGQPEFTERIDDAISSSHLSKEIKNLPFVANMTSFWRYVDIALIPSIRPEPFGLVAIEAMLKSVLVIASDRGGVAEIVQHDESGLLFEMGNAQALADAIVEAATHESLRRRLGRAGRQRVLKTFNIERQIEALACCYSRPNASMS